MWGIVRALSWAVIALWFAAAAMRPAAAQELSLPAEQHAWARFPIGSWKLVRTVSETHSPAGHVEITTTDVKTTLVAVAANSFTLRIETTLETGGRRLPTQSQTQQFGLYGEAPGQTAEIVRTGTSSLVIDGESIPCEVRELTVTADAGRSTSLLHYSSEVAPYILRRETKVIKANGSNETELATSVNVLSLDLPVRVGQQLKEAMHLMTKQQLPSGDRTVLEAEVLDVPGWVVSHRAAERDAEGRLLRRSTLELIDYGLPVAPAAEGGQDKIIEPPPNTSLRTRRLQRKAARRSNDQR
jgi:hypothetical protein